MTYADDMLDSREAKAVAETLAIGEQTDDDEHPHDR